MRRATLAVRLAWIVGLCLLAGCSSSDPKSKTRPYWMRARLSTPVLEPLPLWATSSGLLNILLDVDEPPGADRSDIQACLDHDSEEPIYGRGLATTVWPEFNVWRTPFYWQVQKFRPFSGTLEIHGNRGRLEGFDLSLDGGEPFLKYTIFPNGATSFDLSQNAAVRVTSQLLNQRPVGHWSEEPEFDFTIELDLELDTSRLIEGAHYVTVDMRTPETGYARRRPNDGESTSGIMPLAFDYRLCFEVILNATSIQKGPDGQLWVGTFENGLLKVDLGASKESSSDDAITFFQGDSIDTGPLDLPETKGELSGNSITRLALDPHGNLWVGTFFHDLTVLPGGQNAVKYDIPDIGEFDFDYGTAFNDAQLSRYVLQELSDSVTAFAFLSDRETLVGTLNGLHYLNHQGTLSNTGDDRWVRFDEKDGLKDANVIGLALDDQQRVWIATTDLSDFDEPGVEDGEGLYVLDMNGTPEDKSDDRWGNLTPEDGGFDERVLVFEKDPAGGFWVGTIGGLHHLDDGGTPFDKSDDRWTRYGLNDGFIDEDVSALYFLGPGKYLVGTVDIVEPEPNVPPGGALIYLQLEGKPHEKRIKNLVNYTIEDGFIDSDVSAIGLDSFGRVVFSSFNFFHSALVTALYSSVEAEATFPEAGGGLTFPRIGRDGVSFVELGPDESSKSDDVVRNLLPQRKPLRATRF